MRNLAGETTAHADAYVEDELTEACIPIFPDDARGEVRTKIVGESGAYRFERAWYYWVVSGPVSVPLAKELYEDPRGRFDVRVDGHCGCPEPEAPWTSDVDGVECVTTYHIDSQDGLNLFAEKVLKTRPLPPTEEEKEAAKEIARANHSGRVIYEDGLTEEDYLVAGEEVHAIRRGLTDLRHRLNDLSRGADKGLIPTDSIAHTVGCSLTTAVVTLYQLENQHDDRSFSLRAARTRKLWDDLYRNPTNYVLQKTNGRA